MRRKLKKLFLCLMFAAAAVSPAGADIDYSALANPESYKKYRHNLPLRLGGGRGADTVKVDEL